MTCEPQRVFSDGAMLKMWLSYLNLATLLLCHGWLPRERPYLELNHLAETRTPPNSYINVLFSVEWDSYLCAFHHCLGTS